MKRENLLHQLALQCEIFNPTILFIWCQNRLSCELKFSWIFTSKNRTMITERRVVQSRLSIFNCVVSQFNENGFIWLLAEYRHALVNIFPWPRAQWSQWPFLSVAPTFTGGFATFTAFVAHLKSHSRASYVPCEIVLFAKYKTNLILPLIYARAFQLSQWSFLSIHLWKFV